MAIAHTVHISTKENSSLTIAGAQTLIIYAVLCIYTLPVQALASAVAPLYNSSSTWMYFFSSLFSFSVAGGRS